MSSKSNVSLLSAATMCCVLIAATAYSVGAAAASNSGPTGSMVFFHSPGGGSGQAQVWRFGGSGGRAKPAMRRSSSTAADCLPSTSVPAEDSVLIGTGEVQVPSTEDETPVSAAIEDFKPTTLEGAKAGTGKRHAAAAADHETEYDDEEGEDIAVAAEAHGDESDADHEEDEEASNAEDTPAFGGPGKWKPPVFFPMQFGRSTGGAVAVANSYSVRGSAISHAVAHGSPARRRKVTPKAAATV